MKTRPSLILLLLLILVAFVATAVVYGQSATGPSGKRVYNHANDVLVLPNLQASPGTSGVPTGAITVNGGHLYLYNSTTGLWSKVTDTTPTATPTSTATATATSTSTPTPTPTP